MKNFKFAVSIFAIVILLSACAGVREKKPFSYTKKKYLQEHNVNKLPTYDVPIVINDSVIEWLDYFQGSGRGSFGRHLKRSGRYEKMMRDVLKKYGLPQDLVYVALIESGFLPHAYSRAKAVGTWQFIRSTGKMYKLRVDGVVDERRDPVLATHAAASFFKDLHSTFGDWYLAMAAYNAGPGKVSRAIDKAGTNDFWEIAAANGHFRNETCNYVPKFIAAALIAKQPEKFGFAAIDYDKPLEYDEVEVDSQTDLGVIATLINSSYDEIVDLNPALVRGITPAGENYLVKVPKGKSAEFKVAFASLPRDQRVRYAYHQVKRGQTLARIAKLYGVTIADLRKWNGIARNRNVKTGSTLKIYKDGARKFPGVDDEESSAKVVESTKQYHVLKKGETLGHVAGKYNVGVTQLAKWNGISSAKMVKAGRKLVIYSEKSVDVEPAKVASKPLKKEVVLGQHIVAKGETMSQIAQKYDMTVEELKMINSMAGDRLIVGKKIIVNKPKPTIGAAKKEVQPQQQPSQMEQPPETVPSASIFQYEVKKGDTLWTIAQKHKVTIAQLKEWNSISDPKYVRPGKKLVVKK